MRYALLIPCYEPDERVVMLVSELQEVLYGDIYIVNDGSGSEYERLFRKLADLGCHVVSYSQNRGKGHALKKGIETIARENPDCAYILTADADGQHRAADIRKIADHAEDAYLAECRGVPAPLVLGARDLTGPSVPIRSRIGNGFSSLYFRFVTGVRCGDTQTGLRAIPKRLFALALETPGDRYDYEMNFLIAAAGEIKMVPVETVYNNDGSSHFRTVRDSVLVYKTPLRYVSVSGLSAIVDLSVFGILAGVFTGTGTIGAAAVFLATFVARITSGTVNFSLNRLWSFSSIRASEGKAGRQAIRYLLLFFGLMGASSAFVTLLGFLPLPLVAVKALVDTGLAFFSYWAQHNWVFKTGAPDQESGGHSHSCAPDAKNGSDDTSGRKYTEARRAAS